MAKKTVAKSAVTGKIVSKKFAKENPATTFETPVKPKPAKEIAYLPMVGEKFDLGGKVAEVVSFEPLQVIEHAVINGCQTQSKLLVDNIDGAQYLDPKEAFRRLA